MEAVADKVPDRSRIEHNARAAVLEQGRAALEDLDSTSRQAQSAVRGVTRGASRPQGGRSPCYLIVLRSEGLWP